MPKRLLVLTLACALSARAVNSALSKQTAEKKRPNILFIIADDQSPFDLKVYDPKSPLHTPVIDRLAAEGKIPGFKVGGSWRFRQRDIERWIKTQSAGSEPDEDER